MNLIVSIDNNWGIGKGNSLLFSIKHDMEFFKSTTMNKIVIMGRKTLKSLPNGNPLKNRINIVLTRDKTFDHENVIICNSVDELLNETKKYPDDELFVIGGEEIYRLLLPYCDTAYITKVFADGHADKYMVNLDESTDWEIERETGDFKSDGLTYRFTVYKRV